MTFGCHGVHLAARAGCYRDSAAATYGLHGYHAAGKTDRLGDQFAAIPGCCENCEVEGHGCYGECGAAAIGCRDDCVTACENWLLWAMLGHCPPQLCVDWPVMTSLDCSVGLELYNTKHGYK